MLKAGSTPERALFRALMVDTLCLSPAVGREITEVFERPKSRRYATDARRREFSAIIFSRAVVGFPETEVTDCRDPNDDKYLELALCVAADCIVSSDADLLDLHPWRGIPVLTPAAYLAWRG